MTTYYSNNPSRFGGCYATHNPSVSQVAPTTTVTGGGTSKSKHKHKAIRFSDFESRDEFAEAIKQAAIVTVPIPIDEPDDDDEILLLAITRILH